MPAKKVFSLSGCEIVNENIVVITWGHYTDMGGLIIQREAFIRNPNNKYVLIRVSYRFDDKDDNNNYAIMDESQLKKNIEDQLRNLDSDFIKTFNKIISTFEYAENL